MPMLSGVRSKSWIAAPVALTLASCVTFISQYDEKVDEMATSIQREISVEMETLGSQVKPDCLYPNHETFYRQMKVDVGALAVRAAAHDQNSLTIGQVQALQGALKDFETIHQHATEKNRCLTAAEISPDARGIDQIVGAILHLELAKKRGK
jgi:hypothetical protein